MGTQHKKGTAPPRYDETFKVGAIRIATEQGRRSGEAAQEVGVSLRAGYNGDLTSRQAGSVGGQVVKKVIEAYEQRRRIASTCP